MSLAAAAAARGTPLLVGHRGAAATHPENTLASVAAALDAGCDAVEVDVHVTADSRLAVIHDATLDRTTSGTGAVAGLGWDAVRRLDAGAAFSARFAGERVPALEEVLALCRGRASVLVELKAAFDRRPDAAALVARAVAGCGARDGAALLAFDGRHLAAARAAAPWLERVVLCDAVPDDVEDLLGSLGAAALAPRSDLVGPALCARVHRAERLLVTWTVDSPEEAVRLARDGADAVLTNDPAGVGPALVAVRRPSGRQLDGRGLGVEGRGGLGVEGRGGVDGGA